MGRPGVGARPGDARLVAVLARRLLVVLASLALLASGAAEVLPRPVEEAVSTAAAAGTAPDGHRSEMQAPARAVLARAAQTAVVPGPAGPAAALPPSAGPDVAPHLVHDPQTRPPTAPLPGGAPGAPGSRAPPLLAGT